jgi:hypothetical protein
MPLARANDAPFGALVVVHAHSPMPTRVGVCAPGEAVERLLLRQPVVMP